MSRSKIAAVAIVSTILACSLALGMLRVDWKAVFGLRIDRTSYALVAEAFAGALLREDADLAIELSSSTQEARIRDWSKRHEAFNCPFDIDLRNLLDDMSGEYSGGVGGQVIGSNEASYHWSYVCTPADYSFSVKDISLLRQTDGQWIVVDWEACEKRRSQQNEVCDPK